jgi:hypothetical protein
MAGLAGSGINGGGGYANGYHEDDVSNRYGRATNERYQANERAGGRNRERRVGGYGDFASSDIGYQTQQTAASRSAGYDRAGYERTRANRYPGEEDWSANRNWSRPVNEHRIEG